MKRTMYVCTGRSCRELGSERIYSLLRKKLAPLFGEKKAAVHTCNCLGYCEQGVTILVDDKVVHNVTEQNVFDTLQDESTHRPFRVVEEEIDITDDFLGDI